MIKYRRCTDVSRESIHTAFTYGFSDYAVPMTLCIDAFMALFFGPEGNALSLSFIALDGETPVGLVFGGVRMFDGVRTMRCGALCVGPEYRGKGIARRLMEYHGKAAGDEDCRCMFLEVIKTNERAIAFYEMAGYKAMNTLRYYSIDCEGLPKREPALPVCDADIDAIAGYRDRIQGIHVNWQSEIECFVDSTDHVYLTAKDGEKDIGYIAMSRRGKVEQLYVDPIYRNRGVATNLLRTASERADSKRINICLPANGALECFLVRSGFIKGEVEQYEMYKPV